MTAETKLPESLERKIDDHRNASHQAATDGHWGRSDLARAELVEAIKAYGEQRVAQQLEGFKRYDWPFEITGKCQVCGGYHGPENNLPARS